MLPLLWQTIFPIGDKAQWILQKEESQFGFAFIFRLGNPMTQCFFLRSLFGSSTRQQIKLSQVENLKEIRCSSGTKLKLLSGSRGFYRD